MTEALDELDSEDCCVSKVIRKAIRIARLRGDHGNLWWLSYEMISKEDKAAQERVAVEAACQFSNQEALVEEHGKMIQAYVDERGLKTFTDRGFLDEGKVVSHSVPEIELHIQLLQDAISKADTPQGLHPVDLFVLEQATALKRDTLSVMSSELRRVLARIKQRVHDFLSLTEKQLILGQASADIFERNRQYVDARMGQIAPEVLEQFTVAYRRINEGDPESLSHALTSCRRILKSVADTLYPPREEPIIGGDGKMRVLTDDKFINRLRQFVAERADKTVGKLTQTQIEDLGNRIDRLNELASKGVHATVSTYEVDQCVIQTYLAIGDILRIADGAGGGNRD